jgi:hypothetical protein
VAIPVFGALDRWVPGAWLVIPAVLIASFFTVAVASFQAHRLKCPRCGHRFFERRGRWFWYERTPSPGAASIAASRSGPEWLLIHLRTDELVLLSGRNVEVSTTSVLTGEPVHAPGGRLLQWVTTPVVQYGDMVAGRRYSGMPVNAVDSGCRAELRGATRYTECLPPTFPTARECRAKHA